MGVSNRAGTGTGSRECVHRKGLEQYMGVSAGKGVCAGKEKTRFWWVCPQGTGGQSLVGVSVGPGPGCET